MTTLAAELKKQRRLETERIKALRDAERIELGRMVQEAGLDKDQLADLLTHADLVRAEPVPLQVAVETQGQDVDVSPLPASDELPATPGHTPRSWN